jgi:hypothetical protein
MCQSGTSTKGSFELPLLYPAPTEPLSASDSESPVTQAIRAMTNWDSSDVLSRAGGSKDGGSAI